jgi:transposase
MSDLFWRTDEQIERLRPIFPKSHGKPRVDDRRVLSGIVFVNHHGLRWRDAPGAYGPQKTLYNRWERRGERGVFTRMMDDLPKAQWLLGDRGYDADWFRDALQAKASSPASRAGDDATGQSDTTSAATGAAAPSRSCLAASRTGGALPSATIAAPRRSSPPLLSPPPSSTGCEQ